MKSKHGNGFACLIFSGLLAPVFVSLVVLGSLYSVQATGPIPLTIVGSDGTSQPINDITTLNPTIGWGGYKNTNGVLNTGKFEGVSLLDLCTSIGTSLTKNQNVTVYSTGGNGTYTTFDYDQVANGINLAPQYSTYNNSTGALQSPTQPVNLTVVYQSVNGVPITGGGQSTRLMIVGPEGLLLSGSGLAGVTTITITNANPAATPSPIMTPNPTLSSSPAPSASPNPTLTTPSPSLAVSPSPLPTSTQSGNYNFLTTPTAQSSPQPNVAQLPFLSVAIATIVIVIFVVIGFAFFIRKKQ